MIEPLDLILVVFGSICLIHGLVLSLVIISLPAENHNQTKTFLSAILFILSLRIGKSVIYIYDEGFLPIFATYILHGLNFYIGPLLYAYFLGLKKQKLRNAFLHFSSGTLLILLSPFLPIDWWKTIYLLLIFQTFLYLYLSFRQIETFFRFDNLLDGWKNILFLTVGGVCISYFLVIIFACSQYLIPVITYAVLVYIMTIHLLKGDDIKKLIVIREKYRSSKLSSMQTGAIVAEIDKLLSHNKLYRQSDLSIKDFSIQMGIPESYISQAISSELNINFNELINRKRIADVCESLEKDKQRLMTIEQHAFASGFNSSSTFYSAFKKYNGLTPKTYRDSLSGV